MAQNAKDIQMRELKDLLNELRETNKLLRTALEETRKEKAVLKQERDSFKEQVDYLTKKLFGSSSEKGACDIPGQMNLFNEAEPEMDSANRPSGYLQDAWAAPPWPPQAAGMAFHPSTAQQPQSPYDAGELSRHEYRSNLRLRFRIILDFIYIVTIVNLI
mgnify:CR=1 FL=1